MQNLQVVKVEGVIIIKQQTDFVSRNRVTRNLCPIISLQTDAVGVICDGVARCRQRTTSPDSTTVTPTLWTPTARVIRDGILG